MHVLLVHGLGRTPVSLALLSHRLRRAGHTPQTFGYFAARESYARILARLVERVRAAESTGVPWVAVGHSLGGLLLRDATAAAAAQHLAHLIMLATPNQVPRMAIHARRVALFRWFTGECGERLASAAYYRDLPEPTVPYTIVAGGRGITGRHSPFGTEPNDGIVAVAETVLDSGRPPVVVPAAHTFIMNRADVTRMVLDILHSPVPSR